MVVAWDLAGEKGEVGSRGGSNNASDELLVARSRNWCDVCTFLSVMVSLNEIRRG